VAQGPQPENFEEQLRRGGLELAILLAVTPVRRYGLELIRHLEEATDLVVTEGTVYPILARLTRQGLLRSEWVAAEGPHPRKYYELTQHGRRRVEEMLAHWRAFTGKIERLIEAARQEGR
jgi:PadR family transcriptional regulator PadR